MRENAWPIVIGLLFALMAMPARADEAQESLYNFHIGGGFGVPAGGTANFSKLGGVFQVGAGPNLSKHHSLEGEFMWQGLTPSRSALLPITNAFCLLNPPASPTLACNIASLNASDNLYAVTANYEYHRQGERYGWYVIAGGGWY